MKQTSKSMRGFTLIELLTVIAIIGILAAIAIPVTGTVRKAAKKSKVKVQFSNWVSAMEGFKQEYGYYPQIDTATVGVTRTYLIQPNAFAIALTGRELNGDRVTNPAERFGNKRERSFYSISRDDVSADQTKIIDAFGNSEIAVIFDRNGDGLIKIGTATGDDGELKEVRVGEAPSGTGVKPTNDTATADIPTTGLRASVIFYSAGAGGSSGDIVMSWK